MPTLRQPRSFSAVARALLLMPVMMMAACGGSEKMPTAPDPPPLQPPVTANVFILPDAVSLKNWAFGDEDIVIYKGERMHWVNLDTLTHHLVADSPNATDFQATNDLPQTGEQSFIMTKLGTTKVHCTIHPEMTGVIVVREH